MGKPWTKEDTIIAYALYCVVPFEKINNSNKTIAAAAKEMDRSPASLKMKMCNMANLDPNLRASGRIGLDRGITKMDRLVFEEFSTDWETLSKKAASLISIDIFDIDEPVYKGPDKNKNHFSEIADKQARKFFRKSVLTAYNYTCCVSGVQIPEMLVASHIKPWADSDKKTERVNPANGLCLNVFYDKAFDRGIMTVDTKYKIHISKAIERAYPDDFSKKWLYSLEGESIHLPRKFYPQKDLLEYHNDVIFIGG